MRDPGFYWIRFLMEDRGSRDDVVEVAEWSDANLWGPAGWRLAGWDPVVENDAVDVLSERLEPPQQK